METYSSAEEETGAALASEARVRARTDAAIILCGGVVVLKSEVGEVKEKVVVDLVDKCSSASG